MLKDEQRREKEKLNGRPFSEKLNYFLTYNKFALCASIIAVTLIVWIIITITSFNPNKLYVVITDQQGGGLKTQILDESWDKLWPDKHETIYSTDMELAFTDTVNNKNAADMQKILALYSSKTIDIYIGPEPAIEKYGPEGMFLPLDSLIGSAISREEWEKLKENNQIIYINPLDYSGDSDTPTVSDQTVPVAIRIPDSPLYKDAGLCIDDPCIGVTFNSTRPDEAIAYLKMFLD